MLCCLSHRHHRRIMMASTPKERARESLKDYGNATPPFSLKGTKTWARVVQIYDGDTMTCVLPVLGAHYKFSVRMAGVDACEMRSSNPEVMAKAIMARDRVFESITGLHSTGLSKKEVTDVLGREVYVVWLVCQGWDKYGRLMADVHVMPDGESIAALLLREKLAYAYNGGTKQSDAEQVA